MVPAAHTTAMSISRAARCSRLVFAPVLLVGTLLGTAGLSAPAAGAGPSAPSGSWTNTFDEEFNGTAVDTTKWEPDRYGQDYGGDTPFNPGSEAAWFNTGNVSVSGGNLHLTIRDEPRTLNGKTYPYSSGVVQTAQHHLFTAGTYLEARINVPVCDGCWPAFWTAAPDVWPPEIDGFEYFDTGGSGADTKPQFNYHPPAGGQTGPTVYGDPAVDYRGSFHTYGLLWDGTQAVPYLDGVAYPSGANSDMTRLDQFLLLNLSVQGGHHPAPGSEMLVDWVRAWSPAPAPATEVHGAIAEHYYNTPGLAALFGPTTTPERTTPDTVGRYNHFNGGDGGSIYWSPNTGAWSVHGAIRGHWESLGWEAGPTGYPTTDERTTPDGVGRYNHFTGGDGASIYWTPATGAQLVHGAIRNQYASMGWELSSLGYPVSDEYAVPGGRRSNFAHGSITYRFSDGAILIG